MKRTHVIAAALVAALIAPVTPASAFARDADGSRMQARPIALNSAARDRLAPPSDAVDWRYFRLTEAHDVTVAVEGTPKSVALSITLTDAMGKSLVRGRTSNGSYTTRRRLDPGLYYLSVSATAAASYEISVR